MPSDERLEMISAHAQGLATELGVSLVEVKFGQEGKKRTLEVTIFRLDEPIKLSDCEQFSKLLEGILEEQQSQEQGKKEQSMEKGTSPPLSGPYALVVQSPGIDRVLKTERDFQVFAGRVVQVQTKEKILDLGVKFKGVLLGFNADELKLAQPEALAAISQKIPRQENNESHNEIVVPKSKISEIRLFAPDLQPKPRK